MLKISKFKAVRTLIKGQTRKAGRNSSGKITVRHQGGGTKQYYRMIDWLRQKEVNQVITQFEYDPNRSAYLAKLSSLNLWYEKNLFFCKEKDYYSYILAPKGVKIFDSLQTVNEIKNTIFLRPGDSSILANFEVGDVLHNLAFLKGHPGLYARAAGTFCQIMQNLDNNYIKIRLPSKNQRLFFPSVKATYGILAKEDHYKQNWKKAGRSRWLNIRPTVRGVAMNPIDHPHGGGQGKTKGGRPSVTPNSWPTKGYLTRKKNKRNVLILTKHKK